MAFTAPSDDCSSRPLTGARFLADVDHLTAGLDLAERLGQPCLGVMHPTSVMQPG